MYIYVILAINFWVRSPLRLVNKTFTDDLKLVLILIRSQSRSRRCSWAGLRAGAVGAAEQVSEPEPWVRLSRSPAWRVWADCSMSRQPGFHVVCILLWCQSLHSLHSTHFIILDILFLSLYLFVYLPIYLSNLSIPLSLSLAVCRYGSKFSISFSMYERFIYYRKCSLQIIFGSRSRSVSLSL